MKKVRWFSRSLILGGMVLLLLIPLSAYAGKAIGNWFIISGGSEQEVSPVAAYNSQRQEYLVVWYNDRAGNDDIRAQRLSKYGAPLGGPFYISAGSGADRRYPDVAYNSVQDQYLVVWEHYEAANGYSIKGRRVSETGLVLDASDISIRSWSNLYTPSKPVVSYASTSDCYLVVWAETWHPLPIAHDIYGQMMNHLGNLDGSHFSISSGSEQRESPNVAYNRHANRHLVVWQEKNGALWDVYGQQVKGEGGTYQGAIPIGYYTISSTAPVVAAIPTTPTNDKFLVAFELQSSPGNRDIYSRVIAEDGTISTDVWIASDATVDESSPAIAGDEAARQYLVAWQHPDGFTDIKARAITYAGSWSGDVADFWGAINENPALASGPWGDFLLVWDDQAVFTTHTDIYGHLWGNRTYMPQVVGEP